MCWKFLSCSKFGKFEKVASADKKISPEMQNQYN
ncbi:hypothetical protein T10_5770 [Trichinella papuae]|uniref:Uncharacterized protein n=1 Tax=Trichinella papuae TaxID=268474 RepID=A0A0V1N1U3_9BILA|nr:hypothetical protein T10_5770 [Trichinella papuae]